MVVVVDLVWTEGLQILDSFFSTHVSGAVSGPGPKIFLVDSIASEVTCDGWPNNLHSLKSLHQCICQKCK